MASELTQATTDHDFIRRWVEERGGWPAEVARTEREGETGILRIDFPGYSGEGSLKRISWEEWFDKFDRTNLAFLCQETTASGVRSNFNKLVGREAAEARAQEEPKASRRTRPSAKGRRKAPQRAAARTARRSASARAGSRSGSRAKPPTRSRAKSRATSRKAGGSPRRRTSSR